MVHFFGSEEHFKTHWLGVMAAVGGRLVSSEEIMAPANRDVPVLVASWGDLRKVHPHRTRIIMCEHGCGLSYNGNHASYVGNSALKDERIMLRLVPNHFAADKERQYNPDLPIEICGAPYLDALRRSSPFRQRRVFRSDMHDRPLIVFSTHWDCMVCPETRSSFGYFKQAIARLAATHNIALHAHPHIATQVAMFARGRGIPFIRDFKEVAQTAALYAIDNSSTLFEFAATGKPVLVLNAPEYRRNVEHEHNPRFWSCADVGVNVWDPSTLDAAVALALRDEPAQRARRQAIVAEMFPYLGTATQKAAELINEYAAKPMRQPTPRSFLAGIFGS